MEIIYRPDNKSRKQVSHKVDEVEYYSVLKRKEILSFEIIWINLKNITLSEIERQMYNVI